jgi:hypothetical protein
MARERDPGVEEAFPRARAWLLEVADRDVEIELRPLLQLLLGIWLTEPSSDGHRVTPALAVLLARVDDRVGEELVKRRLTAAHVDPKLLLLALGIMRGQGLRSSAMEAYASTLAGAVGCLTPVPARLVGEALLLFDLGLGRPLDVCPLPIYPIAADDLSLLQAGQDDLRRLSADIASATHFGRRTCAGPVDVVARLRRLLPVVLLQSLRDYHLETATAMARVLGYLGLSGDAAVELGLGFIAAQQRPDGAFGFFAIESERLLASEGADAVLELSLPMTLSCLWTLAEAWRPDFRLFASVTAPASSPQARAKGSVVAARGPNQAPGRLETRGARQNPTSPSERPRARLLFNHVH